MAFPAGTSESQCVEQEGPGISSDRSREDATGTCYLSSGPSGGAVPEQAVSGAEDGTFRPVVNLKALNKFMTKNHFKMEGFHILKDVLWRGDWLSSINLKDAYFSVTIAQPHRKLLHFEWKGKIYEYQCLPFGLSSSPRVFTKLLKPILAWLRQRGVRMIVYLDDILVLESSPEEGKAHVELIIAIL